MNSLHSGCNFIWPQAVEMLALYSQCYCRSLSLPAAFRLGYSSKLCRSGRLGEWRDYRGKGFGEQDYFLKPSFKKKVTGMALSHTPEHTETQADAYMAISIYTQVSTHTGPNSLSNLKIMQLSHTTGKEHMSAQIKTCLVKQACFQRRK